MLPTPVLKLEFVLPVRETAPVFCVRPPVIVVVLPERPIATLVALVVPSLNAAAESTVVFPTVVVIVEAAFPLRLKTPAVCVMLPVNVNRLGLTLVSKVKLELAPKAPLLLN